MRIAIVSDIHGNLTALEAVLADLRVTSPDLIFNGGDLTHGGARPAEVLDKIRDLGWPGVLGNTDEMLFKPEVLPKFAAVQEMAAVECEWLGEERLAWLKELPFKQEQDHFALVHASPESCWKSPMPEASDEELEKVYAPLGKPIAVYAHVHRSFVRAISGLTVINTGSVSLSHDGDPKASYLLLDDSTPTIRRVEYDVERELKALSTCELPHADWVARMIQEARPSMP